MVVMMPMNKLTQERVTKAEDGMEKTKLAGYMRGTEDHLEKSKNCKSKSSGILPIKEEKKDQGANVLFRHACLCVEHEEDENAEGGGDKVERKVPENGCRPVGRRMDSTHKVKMFHLKRI